MIVTELAEELEDLIQQLVLGDTRCLELRLLLFRNDWRWSRICGLKRGRCVISKEQLTEAIRHTLTMKLWYFRDVVKSVARLMLFWEMLVSSWKATLALGFAASSALRANK